MDCMDTLYYTMKLTAKNTKLNTIERMACAGASKGLAVYAILHLFLIELYINSQAIV